MDEGVRDWGGLELSLSLLPWRDVAAGEEQFGGLVQVGGGRGWSHVGDLCCGACMQGCGECMFGVGVFLV